MLFVSPGDQKEFQDLELGEQVIHVFEEDAIEAVNTALAAGRPLLIRGEPGTGKSQLGLAVAAKMNRAFVSIAVDAHSEARDLKFQFDAVARLACAQMLGSGALARARAEFELGQSGKSGQSVTATTESTATTEQQETTEKGET